MDALVQFWSERAPREKAWLLAGAAIVLAAIVYLVLIEPAATGIARLERGLPATRAQAAKLDALLAEVKNLRARPQVASLSPQETRAAVEKSLAAAGLKADFVQLEGASVRAFVSAMQREAVRPPPRRAGEC